VARRARQMLMRSGRRGYGPSRYVPLPKRSASSIDGTATEAGIASAPIPSETPSFYRGLPSSPVLWPLKTSMAAPRSGVDVHLLYREIVRTGPRHADTGLPGLFVPTTRLFTSTSPTEPCCYCLLMIPARDRVSRGIKSQPIIA
jgi:hypothetical protein